MRQIKVPPVDRYFWVMKISATTLGETAGDLVSMTLGLGYARSAGIFFGLLAATLAGQLAARRYRPFLYWTVILLTSTAGTAASDFMDRTLGLGYAKGSAILLAALLLVLAIWRYATRSLSVDNIASVKSELFYWTAIVISNTLGTALGDFLADDSGLGFGGGALLIGGLLAALLVAYLFTRASRVILFWLAFVLTRPFGATLGDSLSKPTADGGLGLGTVYSSLILVAILVGVIAMCRPRPAIMEKGGS